MTGSLGANLEDYLRLLLIMIEVVVQTPSGYFMMVEVLFLEKFNSTNGYDDQRLSN